MTRRGFLGAVAAVGGVVLAPQVKAVTPMTPVSEELVVWRNRLWTVVPSTSGAQTLTTLTTTANSAHTWYYAVGAPMRISLALALLVVASSASAQPQQPSATAASKLTWDQDAPSLAVANSYSYKFIGDTATPLPLTGVVCTGATSPFVCSAPFPAFTPGVPHTIAVTAGNVAGDSLPSVPLAFTFVLIPTRPANLRVS